MEKKLTIQQKANGDQTLLEVTGRLDANWAGFLDDTLTGLIQEGKHKVGLDLQNVVFLSSAGIRILVKQQKAFSAISGELNITHFSENVKTVLDMVGMTVLFTASQKPKSKETSKAETKKEANVHGYRFKVGSTETKPNAKLKMSGSPTKMKDGSFTSADNQVLRFEQPFFGLGLGAFGDCFEDCMARYGEFIALGNGVAFLPSNNTNTPDYMVKTGKLIPEINTLYYMGIDESFQNEIIFNPESETAIGLSQVVEILAELGNHQNFAFLMLAESAGLIGSTLNTSPVSGKNIFQFPEVREHINFTTEPAHLRALTVVFGIISKKPNDTVTPFLRPIGNGFHAHFHAAVFPNTPLQKEDLNYNTTLQALFNNSEVLDVMHLLNDRREINGLGESIFKSGHCWTTEIDL